MTDQLGAKLESEAEAQPPWPDLLLSGLREELIESPEGRPARWRGPGSRRVPTFAKKEELF